MAMLLSPSVSFGRPSPCRARRLHGSRPVFNRRFSRTANSPWQKHTIIENIEQTPATPLCRVTLSGYRGRFRGCNGNSMKHNIYLVSGLGADERVFRYLHFSGAGVFHIQWIDPLKNELIEPYASRLSSQIMTSDNNSVIGVSFGGRIAVELSTMRAFSKVIIISSKNRQCLYKMGPGPGLCLEE